MTKMRQLVVLVGVTVLLLGPAVQGRARGAEGARSDVRVMTFNIRFNNPGDGQNAWPHRETMVADMIQKHADIAGLQEAQLDQIQDLEKRLTEFAWYGVGREDGKKGGEFCPIFYRKDRFEVLAKHTRWLSETPTVAGSRSWDAAITRLVTIIRFRDKANGVEFVVLNTHFDHRGSQAREQSARLIKQNLYRLGAKIPLLITGDFNCTPDQKPYKILTAKGGSDSDRDLVDSRTISQKPAEGPDSTWCGFREIIPGRRIDFIFVGPRVTVKRHQTIGDRVNGRFPSDHLPVVINASFGGK